MSIWIDLSSDVAVVFGGGSGIGEGVAAVLATAGAKVVVADQSAQAAHSVAEQITNKGGIADGTGVDVTDEASVSDVLALAREHFGPTSVLVNSAATWVTADTLVESTLAETSRIVESGLIGAINTMRRALPDLQTTRGAVVNITHDCARTGEISMSAHAAGGGGVLAATRSFAREVGPRGVRANAVTAGPMVTPTNATVIEQLGGAEQLVRAFPLGRLGTPADVANAVLFLLSPLSAWITGQTLSVNGGHIMI
ncbi:MAG TPA: SDR family oxidoreductase [Pseudonocardia sp.]|nr:SDR family oxidoreductase [Pseudonocardia sp.]